MPGIYETEKVLRAMAEHATSPEARAAYETAVEQLRECGPDRDEAEAVLRRDYWSDVRGIIQAARTDCPADEDPSDWLHETVDGHQRVVYTWLAREGLLWSGNPDAHLEEMGEPPATPEVAMYCALRADVEEHAEWAEWLEEREGEPEDDDE